MESYKRGGDIVGEGSGGDGKRRRHGRRSTQSFNYPNDERQRNKPAMCIYVAQQPLKINKINLIKPKRHTRQKRLISRLTQNL